MMTTEELEEFLKVSRTTLYEWRKKGMPCIKMSRLIRYDKESVIKWLDEQTIKNEQ